MSGAIHGIVEATPGWVTGRLDILAKQMLLPTPALDGFLFPANAAFYAACTESIVSLQRAAKRIVQHLGLACDTVICAFKALPNPANIQRVGNDWFMEIDPAYRDDGLALGAILAHEVCHILVEERGVPRFENAVDEVHVDLAVMLSGLGALTLNAIETKVETRGNLTYTQHRSFGYLRAPLMRHAYAVVCDAMGIGTERATDPLVDIAARYAVRWKMIARRRTRLAYKPPGAHVIVPCTSLACTKRLRLPAGKEGKATCPECKTARDFDGRACLAEPRDAVVPIREAQIPPPPNVLDNLLALPLGAKLLALIVVGLLAAAAFSSRG